MAILIYLGVRIPRAHTDVEPSRVWSFRVVTGKSLDTSAMHGHGIYVGEIVRRSAEKERGEGRRRKNSPDLPQVRDRNLR